MISTISLLLVINSCGDIKNDSLPNVSYKPKGSLTQGTLDSSSKYSNSYFGFSFNCPQNNWIILNKVELSKRQADNKDLRKLSDNNEAELAADYQIKKLIIIEKKIAEYSTSPQSIHFSVDLLKDYNVTSALDYLNYFKKYSKKHLSSNYPKTIVTNIDAASIGNRPFLVQSITIEVTPTKKHFVKVYSAQFGKHLLNILTNYDTQEQQIDNEKNIKTN